MKKEYSRYLASVREKIVKAFGKDIKARFAFIKRLVGYSDFNELPNDLIDKLAEITGESVPGVG